MPIRSESVVQRALFVIALLFATMACAVYQVVPLEDAPELLSSGDKVRVTTTAGQAAEFEVVSVSSEQVTGESEEFRLEELATLERRKIDLLRSTGLYLLIGVVVLALAGGPFG